MLSRKSACDPEEQRQIAMKDALQELREEIEEFEDILWFKRQAGEDHRREILERGEGPDARYSEP